MEELARGIRPRGDEVHRLFHPLNLRLLGGVRRGAPIQLHETAWLIIKREELLPAKDAKINDPAIRTQLTEQMKEVKESEAVASLFEDLMRVSEIDNKLTGYVKMANEDQHPEYKQGLDQKVERMSAAGETPAKIPTGGRSPETAITSPKNTAGPPPGVPAGAAAAAGSVQQTVKSAPRTATPPGNN